MKPVQWKEGGHETSNDAQAGPRRGAARKQAGLTLLARFGLGVVLLGALASACDSGNHSASTAAPASPAPATAAAAAADDCSTQADVEAFIESQIAQGHWQRVGQVANMFRVYVTPAFMAETTPDERQQALAVVSAYSQCAGGGTRVAIHDATTGKRIGVFSDAGLELK